MRSRRFTVLAAGLVALNLFFWLAPPGQALRSAVINQLFGQRLIRAEVFVQDPTSTTPLDYRIDRGVITAAAAGSVTIREADGTTWTIPVDGSTRLQGAGSRLGLAVLARRSAQVLVIRLANGPATEIDVEGLARAGGARTGGVRAGGAGVSHRRVNP